MATKRKAPIDILGDIAQAQRLNESVDSFVRRCPFAFALETYLSNLEPHANPLIDDRAKTRLADVYGDDCGLAEFEVTKAFFLSLEDARLPARESPPHTYDSSGQAILSIKLKYGDSDFDEGVVVNLSCHIPGQLLSNFSRRNFDKWLDAEAKRIQANGLANAKKTVAKLAKLYPELHGWVIFAEK